MMKRYKNMKFLIMLIILNIMPLTVYADSISIKCPTEIVAGNEVSCTVKGNATTSITSISADIVLGSNLTYVSFTPGGSWQGDALDKSIDFYTSNEIKGDFDIGVLKVKSSGKGNNSIEINSVVFSDDSAERGVNSTSANLVISTTGIISEAVDGNEDNDGQDITDLSNNSYLADLIIEGYEINFNKDIYEYTLNVVEDSLEVIPELDDDTAKYTISGADNLVDGSVIEINVVAEDGSSSVYKINILKDNTSNDVNNDMYKIGFIVIIVLLILINIVRIVNSKKKNNN